MSETIDTTSVVDKPSGTKVESQAIDYQKEIERLTKAAQDASAEAAKYRVEKKAATEAELAKNGQLAELNGTLQKERDELTAKNAELAAKQAASDAKLLAIETARRTELLAKLPSDKQASYVGFGLEVLEQITKDFATTDVVANSQGNDRGNGNGAAKPDVDLPTVPFAGASAKSLNILRNIFKE